MLLVTLSTPWGLSGAATVLGKSAIGIGQGKKEAKALNERVRVGHIDKGVAMPSTSGRRL